MQLILPKPANNCIYLSNQTAEKLSGGFYDHSYIPETRGYSAKHCYFAVTYILQGSGIFRDYRSNEYHYQEGDLLIRHPDLPYFTSKHRRSGCWLEFSTALPASFYQALLAAGILSQETTFLSPGLSQDLISAAELVVKGMSEVGFHGGRARVYAAFLNWINLAAEKTRQENTISSNLFSAEQACALLSRNEQQNSVRQIAAKLNMGYENFRKQFKNAIGISPNEYRIRKKLEFADSLLCHTRLSLKEIAEKLQYKDLSDFSRQYKKYRGFSPGKTRYSHNEYGQEKNLISRQITQ
ncbi:MAG: AraC family transcriptional regulator [Lentisphaeria bacterium]|nr:AraC family transcriptional regulator [Lentisphaeria bacterium]